MAYAGKNPRLSSAILTDALATTPSSPPSGAHKLIDRNGQLFVMDSAGTETPVGGGAGEKNYILSPSSAVGWTASGAGITVAVDTTAAELPRGLTTKTGIKITGVSGSTAYAYYRFTLDQADYNRKLKIKFDLRPISGYVASDMKVDLYSNTASNYGGTSTRVATSSDSSSIAAIPNLTGQYQTTVDMPGSSAPYMELRIGLNATSTQAIVVSDVIVGPGVLPQGAVISLPASFTPSGSWSANTTYTGNYTRLGNLAIFSVKVATAGAPTSAALTITMPTGMTIDTSYLTDTGAGLGSLLSSGEASDSGTSYKCLVKYSSTTAVAVAYQSNASGAESNVTQAAPFTFGASDYVDVKFMVPIAEWAGSGTVNVAQNDVEYVSNSSTADSADTTSFVYGSAGSAVPGTLTAARKKRVSFSTPIQATDTLLVEIQPAGTGSWIPVIFQDAADNVAPYTVQNAKTYGIGLVPVSATTVDVIFGQYAAPTGTTFDSAGTAWGSVTASTRYRVRKITGGQSVGFATATALSKGLVTSYTPNAGSSLLSVSSANYAILDSDGYSSIYVTTGNSNRTITLPSPVTNIGRSILISKVDNAGSGFVIIAQNGSETIGGVAGSQTLYSAFGRITVTSDGTNWQTSNVWDLVKTTWSSSATSPTNTQFGNAGSIANISPGYWVATGAVQNTRVSSQTTMTLAISTNSGNTTTDHVAGVNVQSADFGAWSQSSVSVGPYQILITTTSTTVYLKVKQDAGTFVASDWPGNLVLVRGG